jgi:hypothetical protein
MYPEDYASQRKLFKDVLAKHTADGAASPIKPYLTQQAINLATDALDGDAADLREDARALLSKQSENYRQLRDLQFSPVFKRLKGEVQFLKGLFKPNVSQLGDWGITVDSGDRINYPPQFVAQHTVFTDFKTKHASFPVGTSPLEPYLLQHKINIATDTTDADAALGSHKSFQQAALDAEDATQDRNNLWNPVMAHVRGIGDFLKKLFNDNAKQLGYWGYVIDDSPRAPKERISKVLPAGQITIKSIIVGSTLTNMGQVELHVYRGKTTIGTPSIVSPGELLGMISGYSTITVVDPSTLVAGKFKVLVSQ